MQRTGQALQKSLDPDHSPHGVAAQLGEMGTDGAYPMDGFSGRFDSQAQSRGSNPSRGAAGAASA
ncbi:MAG: hypothetical protein ACJ780_21905 [Solirubrobacteraceae bacterium]